jgi:hypothetical protein
MPLVAPDLARGLARRRLAAAAGARVLITLSPGDMVLITQGNDYQDLQVRGLADLMAERLAKG